MSMVNSVLATGNTGEANYVKALILYTSKMYSDALEEVQTAIRVSPNNTKYVLARAQINIEMLDYTRAIDDANTVLNKNPDSIPARLVIAKALILTSSEENAETQLEEIAKSGENPEYYKLRGMLAKRRGDDNEAKKNYNKYLKIAGGTPSCALDCAEFFESCDNEKDEAIELYKAIIDRYPDSFFATRSLEALQRLDPSYTPNSSAPSVNSADGDSNKSKSNIRPGNMKY